MKNKGMYLCRQKRLMTIISNSADSQSANKSENRFEHRIVSSASSLHRLIVHSTCSTNRLRRYRLVCPCMQADDFIEYDVSTRSSSVGCVVLYGHSSNKRKSHGKSNRATSAETQKCSRVCIFPLRILLLCALLPHHVVLGCSILMVERHVSAVPLDLFIFFRLFCLCPVSDEEEVYSFLVEEGLFNESNYGFHITRRGRILIHEGGFKGRLRRERRSRVVVLTGVISSVVAAIASILSLLL